MASKTGWNGVNITTAPTTLFDPAASPGGGKCAAMRIKNTGSTAMQFNIVGIHDSGDWEGLDPGAEVIKRAGDTGIGIVTAQTASGSTTCDGGKHVIL